MGEQDVQGGISEEEQGNQISGLHAVDVPGSHRGEIDIHGGGVDLKFPHHENEQAQNRAANSCSLANYWMHNGHVMVEGQKMSKSLGNFITAHELLEKYSANIIRLAILKNNYRSS